MLPIHNKIKYNYFHKKNYYKTKKKSPSAWRQQQQHLSLCSSHMLLNIKGGIRTNSQQRLEVEETIGYRFGVPLNLNIFGRQHKSFAVSRFHLHALASSMQAVPWHQPFLTDQINHTLHRIAATSARLHWRNCTAHAATCNHAPQKNKQKEYTRISTVSLQFVEISVKMVQDEKWSKFRISELELLQEVAQCVTTPDRDKISQWNTAVLQLNRLQQQQPKKRKACRVLSTRPQFHPKPRYILRAYEEEQQSRLEGQSDADLRALLDGLGVDFRRDGDQRLWPELVLDQCADLSRVVDAGLHEGKRVQSVLGADYEGVLVAREAMGQLRPNSCVRFVHNVVIWCSEAVSLVVPARRKIKSKVENGWQCTQSWCLLLIDRSTHIHLWLFRESSYSGR